MAKQKEAGSATARSSPDPFRRLSPEALAKAKKGSAHVFGKGHRCDTDTPGHPTPDNHGPVELVLDSSDGFIPLWQKGVLLRWRFQEQSLRHFSDVNAAKAAIRKLMGQALLLWGDAVPIKFSERKDAWDFEVVAKEADNCDINGCVLASSFFPDQGRHELLIYPKTFDEPMKEQVDTLAHEFGHVFGLRHFFAQISEKKFPSVKFGHQRPFSIMNYGAKSVMTPADRADLKALYEKAWAGELTQINGTRIKLVKPFHMA
jgi:Metallo-peptidase family M12B Reprolysin-like